MPDADAAASAKRADPFAPLTSDMLDVGDGHELYVESVGRADGIPAVYLHRRPRQRLPARSPPPVRSRALLRRAVRPARLRPQPAKGIAPDTTPRQHLIADMERIREKFGFERWMVVGGSWGATLALAYAEAHPERVSGIVLRATFLGTQAEVVDGVHVAAAAFLSGAASRIFSSVLPPEERERPVEAYWRRILDADPAVHGLAARAWHDTERALSEHKPAKTRIDLATLNVWRTLPATPFMEAHYFVNDSFMSDGPIAAQCGQARRHSRHHHPGALRSVVPAWDIGSARQSLAGFRDPHRGRSRPFAL